MSKTAIKISNLIKSYRTDEVETTALNNINIEINEGEFVAIMGPSGCGKSTLLNTLGLLDRPDKGQFLFHDSDITAYSEKRRSTIRKEHIGFIFQNFNLIDELTVYENVELPLLYLGHNSGSRKEVVLEALENMQVAHRADHYPQQLSGGQQQRVAIARAVVSKPKILLADEPTGNLDSKNGLEVMKLLTDLNNAGTTIIMVTHSNRDAKYAHRVINLFDGHVVSESLAKNEEV